MKILRFFMSLLLALSMTGAFAGKLPGNFPTSYSGIGTLDDIQFKESGIVVGDKYYPTAEVVLVHDANGNTNALSKHHRGKYVGVVADSTGRQVIREIWIFPKGYKSR